MNKKPIVHAYFVCYNEETILPHLLKYYLTFCEKITILDNGSTDKSIEIIKSYKNVDVLNFNSNNEFNDYVHIILKNQIWKTSINVADFVIVGDIDEFLYHPNMTQFLIDSKNNGYTIFKPFGYHMVGENGLELTPDDNIFEKVTDGVRTEVLDKMMMFDCNKIKEINYNFGCHFANPSGEIKLFNNPDLKMLHFKFLGLKNHLYRNNIRRERLSEFNKKNGFGTYYLYTDDEVIEDYKSYYTKKTKVI
jgi:hypothetical protein